MASSFTPHLTYGCCFSKRNNNSFTKRNLLFPYAIQFPLLLITFGKNLCLQSLYVSNYRLGQQCRGLFSYLSSQFCPYDELREDNPFSIIIVADHLGGETTRRLHEASTRACIVCQMHMIMLELIQGATKIIVF